MADVRKMPGGGCLHYTRGRCLYQEHLNPGYAARWRCRVLLHWEDSFDDFLLRAEAMNVPQNMVTDLWERKFQRMARQMFACDEFVYEPECGVPACTHVHDGLCRLGLPECEGRCRHYAAE